MNNSELENIEMKLLLKAVYDRYGYDFRDYARASLERRARMFSKKIGREYLSELIPLILRDELLFQRLVKEFQRLFFIQEDKGNSLSRFKDISICKDMACWLRNG